MQYPINPFLVAGHRENSFFGVKFYIKGLQRAMKVILVVFLYEFACFCVFIVVLCVSKMKPGCKCWDVASMGLTQSGFGKSVDLRYCHEMSSFVGRLL